MPGTPGINDHLVARPASRVASVSPLSHFQAEYAERERRRPGTYATILRSFAIEGPLDLDALGRGVAALARRHDALRTRIVTVDDEPGQELDEAAVVALTVIEATADAVADLERDAALEPFDLTAAPLFRIALLRLAPDRHVLLLTAHHIVCDGWSMQVLLDDLEALYAAARDGGEPDRPPPAYGQREVVAWQAAQTERELPAAARRWRTVLAKPLEPLPPALADATGYRNARRLVEYGPDVAEAVTLRAQELRTTPFLVLLAAFQAVVGRLTGATDVPVASLFAGRDRPEFADVVGLLATITVVRGDLTGAPTFATLVHRAQEQLLDASESPGLPLWRIVRELDEPEATIRRLSACWLNLLPAPGRDLNLAGLAVTTRPPVTDLGYTKTAVDWGGEHLALSLATTEAGLRGHLDFNALTVTSEQAEAVIEGLAIALTDPEDNPVAGPPG